MSLRISDLLAIKFSDLDIPNRALHVKEQKTGKAKEIRLNSAVIDVINDRKNKYPDDVYLFQVHSNRTKNIVKPISRASVSKVFQEASKYVGGVAIGTHSMRKSRGKAMYEDGQPLAVISKMFNHRSEAETLRYIGITKEIVQKTYDDYIL